MYQKLVVAMLNFGAFWTWEIEIRDAGGVSYQSVESAYCRGEGTPPAGEKVSQ